MYYNLTRLIIFETDYPGKNLKRYLISRCFIEDEEIIICAVLLPERCRVISKYDI